MQLEPIHRATAAGDLAALRRAYADAPGFPNVRDAHGTSCLAYAIAQGPLPLIAALLALGADPNAEADDGFPSLLAAIDRPGPDRHVVLGLLLAAGARTDQRGINDYTPLHHAACRDDAEAVALLLAHGADPAARTRIDDRATPLEEAERAGCARAAAALRAGAERARRGSRSTRT
jgi:ankyrin repeat protein